MTEVLSGGRTAAVLGCAAGTVMFTGTMSAAQAPAPGASLSTSITLVGRSALGADRLAAYSVTVRPAGGVARGAALTLITQQPVRWGGHPSECRSAGRTPQLRCVLGNLDRARSVQVTVRIPGGLRAARGLRIVAVAGASNVARQSVTEALLPAPAQSPSQSPSKSPHKPSATVTPPSAVVAPPRGPRRVKPRRPARPKRPQTGAQALQPPLSMVPPMQQPPPMMPAPAPLPAPMPLPPMQAVPPLPMTPPMAPAMPGQPALPGQPGQPALPSLTPGASAPSVAPAPAPSATATPPSATDGTQMTMISPAGGDEGEGTSWAVVLGIAIVAEVALLWIAACLGLWRRRRLIATQQARSEARAPYEEAPGRRLPRPLTAATGLVRTVRRRLRRV